MILRLILDILLLRDNRLLVVPIEPRFGEFDRLIPLRDTLSPARTPRAEIKGA
jgi:hypothetical protein